MCGGACRPWSALVDAFQRYLASVGPWQYQSVATARYVPGIAPSSTHPVYPSRYYPPPRTHPLHALLRYCRTRHTCCTTL